MWSLLAEQEEVLHIPPKFLQIRRRDFCVKHWERIPERIEEQTVVIAESSGEAGSFEPGGKDTTSADATAVAKYAGEARLPGTAKQSATTISELAVSSGEAGPFWSGTSAAAAVAKPANEARSGD